MEVGAASVCITPPVGVELEGYASRKGVAEGVHDELYASSLWIEVAGEAFVFISLDLIGIPPDLNENVRKILQREFGLKPQNILIAATHTHSGPAMIGIQEGNDLNKKWLELLPYKITASVEMSRALKRPCSMKVGAVEEKDVGKNRRRVGGKTDPILTAASFSCGNKVVAIIVNYACHATVLDHTNKMISADFVCFLRWSIKNFKGFEDAVVLFFNGAEGDVNIGYSAEDSLLGKKIKIVRDFSSAERIGTILALDSLISLLKGENVEVPCIASIYDDLTLGTRKQEFPLQKRTVNSNEELESFYREQAERISSRISHRVLVPLQLIRLGDLTIFALPFEPFSELGLRLRRLAGTKYVMVIGLANGYYGYLPTEEAFQEGGYETKLGPWSYLEKQAFSKVLSFYQNSLKVLEEKI